jgi:hypothetical protein
MADQELKARANALLKEALSRVVLPDGQEVVTVGLTVTVTTDQMRVAEEVTEDEAAGEVVPADEEQD